MARPALLSLHEQINALTNELEASAPSTLPRGVGKVTSVMLTREICDWHRFNNRRAISSYTALCPGERSSGSKRVPGSVTKRGNPRGPRGVGGVCLAHGAFPATVSAGAKAFGRAGQRLTCLGRGAQKGDRSRGASCR
jgi:transposase